MSRQNIDMYRYEKKGNVNIASNNSWKTNKNETMKLCQFIFN